MRKNVLGLGLLLLGFAAAPAFAADPCEAGKWPLARELDWFKAAKPAGPGDLAPGGAAVFALEPVETLAFPVAPSRKPADKSFGKVIAATVPADGLYQVTLSDEAWIELVQGGKLLKVEAFTGIKDCPGLRKSVRFRLEKGPATIEISGASGDRLLIAFAPDK